MRFLAQPYGDSDYLIRGVLVILVFVCGSTIFLSLREIIVDSRSTDVKISISQRKSRRNVAWVLMMFATLFGAAAGLALKNSSVGYDQLEAVGLVEKQPAVIALAHQVDDWKNDLMIDVYMESYDDVTGKYSVYVAKSHAGIREVLMRFSVDRETGVVTELKDASTAPATKRS
jgi:hypothetical protein